MQLQDNFGLPVNNVQIKTWEGYIPINENSDNDSLHKSIFPILLLAKIMGLFPLQGLRGKNASYLV